MRKDLFPEMYEIEKDYFWYKAKRLYVLDLVSRFKKNKKKKISFLDVGCGTGCMLQDFEKYGRVYGLDISKQAVNFCHERGLKNVKAGKIENNPYKQSKFDVITALDIVEHVSDDFLAVKKMADCLKKDGLLIMTTSAYPWFWSYWDEVAGHYRRYVPKQVELLFRKTGLKIEYLRFTNMSLFLPALVFRTVKKTQAMKNEISSDFVKVPKLLNWLLIKILHLESRVAKYLPLPFGLSFIVVGRKK